MFLPPLQVCLLDNCDAPLPLFGPGGLLSPSVAVAMSVSACLLLLSVAVLVFVMQASSDQRDSDNRIIQADQPNNNTAKKSWIFLALAQLYFFWLIS